MVTRRRDSPVTDSRSRSCRCSCSALAAVARLPAFVLRVLVGLAPCGAALRLVSLAGGGVVSDTSRNWPLDAVRRSGDGWPSRFGDGEAWETLRCRTGETAGVAGAGAVDWLSDGRWPLSTAGGGTAAETWWWRTTTAAAARLALCPCRSSSATDTSLRALGVAPLWSSSRRSGDRRGERGGDAGLLGPRLDASLRAPDDSGRDDAVLYSRRALTARRGGERAAAPRAGLPAAAAPGGCRDGGIAAVTAAGDRSCVAGGGDGPGWRSVTVRGAGEYIAVMCVGFGKQRSDIDQGGSTTTAGSAATAGQGAHLLVRPRSASVKIRPRRRWAARHRGAHPAGPATGRRGAP
jgi:hypothetical protein